MQPLENLERYLYPRLNLKSRIHPFQGYLPAHDNHQIFIKRDDELGSGYTGSKLRKYSSLLQHILTNKFDQAIIIGGWHSNNVVGLLQILKQHQIKTIPLLLESHQEKPVGNALFIQMLTEEDEIIEVNREDWHNVEPIAKEIKEQETQTGHKTLIIPEGAFMKEALPGAMTLGADIFRNEQEHNIHFDQIFIDSGTAITSMALLLSLQMAGKSNRKIYVTLIAGSADEYRQRWKRVSGFYEALFQQEAKDPFEQITFLKPPVAASFGAINKTVLKETVHISKQTGLLMDPIYSIKHLMAVKQYLTENHLDGKSLFIYNGGSLGLAGFQEKLAEVV